MASGLRDSDFVIYISKSFRRQHGNAANPDSRVLVESMDSFVAKFRFLATFLRYTQMWSDAHRDVPNLKSLVMRVAAAAKVFRKDLHNAYVYNYGYRNFLGAPLQPTGGLANLWRRTKDGMACCTLEPPESSTMLDFFARLNEKVEQLKPEIREAYGHLSSNQVHPLPPNSFLCQISSWRELCEYVEQNLEFLQEKYEFGDPLVKHISALKKNLYSVRWFLKNSYFEIFPSEDNLVVHFVKVVFHAAHVCCSFWFTEMDQNSENDMAILLADLQLRIDLASPEFLDRIFQFLGQHRAEIYTASFVRDMLGVPREIVLHNELVSLVTCALEMLKMEKPDLHRLSIDIKAVVLEARSLMNIDHTAWKIDCVLLFARIWFLEAEIFHKKQISGRTLQMLPIEDQIEALHQGSRSIRAVLTPLEDNTENQMLVLIEQVLTQVDSVHQSSYAEESITNKVSDVLYKFLVQIMLFKAKELLLQLLNSHASFVAPMKRQITILHEGLVLVIEVVINQSKEITEDEKLTFTFAEAVAAGVTSFCNSFPAEGITEDAINKMELWVFDLLAMVQVLKAKLKEHYLEVPRLNFPKIPGLGFIEYLSGKLRQLLSYNLDSVAYVTHQIETILEDFESLILNFRGFQEKSIKIQEVNDLYMHLVHMSNEAEYVIDSIVVHSGGEWNHLLWLYHISEEIRLFKLKVSKFQDKAYDVGDQNSCQTARREILQASAIGTDEDVVDLDDQQKVIVHQLMGGSSQREIVSIVGMPGIGKTTLAKKVYSHPEVMFHFHIRTWCRISQVYTKRDLLLEILSHFLDLTYNILTMDNEDLELLLSQSLRRNRYLIVMDDMWKIRAWDDLKSSFPDDKNGSRILTTSRHSDVVSEITMESNILHLRSLSDDESWELMRMKIFPRQCCSEELWEVGKEIARNCQGLPLSVVAISGLLKRRNMKPNSWKQIARNLNSLVVNDPQAQCMEILELSYKDLPDYLKPCFLYFGVFQEGKEIPIQRLTWLWMAEGFIQKNDAKSLEDLAEDYLTDLIGRNLITVAKRRSDSGVKTCQAHDMIRALCLWKAKHEKFLGSVTCDDEPYASFDDNVDLEDFEPSYSVDYEEHRLCISMSRNHFAMSRPTGSYVRSLLYFATTDMYPRCPYDVSFISRNFKFLKILDLECINMGNSFAVGIELLVQLSYLAVGGDIDYIPPSLANLRNLETFVVKGLKGKVRLPDTIWHMKRLRHLHVRNRVSFNFQDEEVGSSATLINFVSLTLLSLYCGEHIEEIIRRLPNIRKLSCIFSKSRNESMNCNGFPRFEDLTKLEALKILCHGKCLNTGEFNFPLSLKKLSLSNFLLREDHISTIGSLETLEVLKLSSVIFEDAEWKMSEGEFPHLKFLKLVTVNIEEWDASGDHLPCLEHLVLQKCVNLKEVPIDFVDIETLQIIEVQRCRESVEMSVRRIKEEEGDRYGADNLKVLIYH